MANQRVYKCFIASPSDTTQERNACEEVFADINNTLCPAYNIHLKSVRWENDVHPGVGLDGQDVINHQVMDDYNLFIGIMHARFGTPTHRAGSGTEEEYDIAYSKHQNNEIDEIMFYFCTKSPDNLDSIDTGQLEKIRAFKDKIQNQGVLYWSFTDVDDFKKQLRLHLCQFINKKFGKKGNVKRTGKNAGVEPKVKQKEKIHDYYAEWKKISEKLYRNEAIAKEVKTLIKLKSSIRFSKRTYSQQSCIESLTRQKRKLNYDESILFILAMQDLGRIPVTPNIPSFLDDSVLEEWNYLDERRMTIQGSSSQITGNDKYIYLSFASDLNGHL